MSNQKPRIFVVVKVNGDGYHLTSVDLIVAYHSQEAAEQCAEMIGGICEEVPLAPQKITWHPEED